MKLYVKHMVSLRCKHFVREVFVQMRIPIISVDLGVVEVKYDISGEQRKQLSHNLGRYGFELIEDNKNILVERIKNIVIKMVHYSDEIPMVNYSTYLSDRLQHDYKYLSNIFSQVKGMTIQQFIILHKIEKTKMLLCDDDASLKEIASKLRYSSVAHLSNQFKKIEGITPSEFKKYSPRRVNTLEAI